MTGLRYDHVGSWLQGYGRERHDLAGSFRRELSIPHSVSHIYASIQSVYYNHAFGSIFDS